LRFPIYSLRTGILSSLTVLILLAMFLVNVVMLKFSERDLVEAELDTGRALVQSVSEWTASRMRYEHETLSDVVADPGYGFTVSRMLESGGFRDALIVNPHGVTVCQIGPGGGADKAVFSSLRKALTDGGWMLDFSGRTWGVIWTAPEILHVSGPILSGGERVGAVAVSASLKPLYANLRKSERAVLVFIGLNTLILVLFGLYLLSRTVVRPIYRLLRVTEKFEEVGVGIPEDESSKNEIGQLYRSLRGMLKRLEENKKDLKETISSLETTNLKLKQAQGDMIRSEKLASVGRLATGIAHEIGNPLGIILGYLDLLKGERTTKEERADFLSRAEAEITRINRILRELLDFARPSVVEKALVEMHRVVEETLDMLSPQPMMEGIDIYLQLRAEKTYVLGDGDKLKQVVLNMVINAADAMPSAKDGSAAMERQLTVRTENQENVFLLVVSDSGTGISPSHMGAIFDPFFTTKDPGKGTGLGLSVCYTVIEGMGGTIEVESQEGEGTTIRVKIPLANPESQ